MRKLMGWVVSVASLFTMSANALAIPSVPEIDAGGAAIAVGLVAGLVALIRERR